AGLRGRRAWLQGLPGSRECLSMTLRCARPRICDPPGGPGPRRFTPAALAPTTHPTRWGCVTYVTTGQGAANTHAFVPVSISPNSLFHCLPYVRGGLPRGKTSCLQPTKPARGDFV